MVKGEISQKGYWGYTPGGRSVTQKRLKDPYEDAQFQPGTNKFWIRFAAPFDDKKAVAVWVFENASPGKEYYQKRHGEFLVRDIEFKICSTAAEAIAAKTLAYPGHWTMHKFMITWE